MAVRADVDERTANAGHHDRYDQLLSAITESLVNPHR
jgi:hypothetical protein